MLSVGGEKQPSVKGIEDFVIRFSDMIDKEIGGYYISKKSSNEISSIYISRYERNTATYATSIIRLPSVISELNNKIIYFNTHFHTHLSQFDTNSRTTNSRQDYIFKTNQTQNVINRFIILTRGYLPIEY